MIKAVIFDWGGVLAPNPAGGWLNVLSDMLSISVDDALPHWRSAGYLDLSKGLITKEEFWKRFEKSYGHTLPKDRDVIWRKGSALSPFPEMMQFVGELKNKGIYASILSNTVRPMSELARRSNLYDLFEPIVLSDEVGLIKPSAEIYSHILDKLNVEATECIYVDDLPANLIPAKEMGMRTVLATHDPSKTISDIKTLLN